MSVNIGTEADGHDYLEVNKKSWDSRAAAHAASPMYNVNAFISDPSYISNTVRFDLPRLPSLSGLDIAHLQCHIGTDTLSLARLGASTVTGLDFSSESLKQARSLVSSTHDHGGSQVSFVEGDVYDSVSLLGAGKFDMVFTGIGALGWLPDISKWAKAVSGLLKPEGKFFIREGHPILWALDVTLSDSYPEEQLRITYPYFEIGRPFVGAGATLSLHDPYGSHTHDPVSKDTFEVPGTKEFNHGLGEVIQALLVAGMRITMVQEHETAPWNALPGRMEAGDLGEFGLKKIDGDCLAVIRSRQ